MTPGPGIKNTSLFTPYTAYSRNGTAEGKLVYVNQGTEKDLEELEKRNISLNGTILLSRNYFGFFKTVGTFLVTLTVRNVNPRIHGNTFLGRFIFI